MLARLARSPRVRRLALSITGTTGLDHLARMVPVADLVHELGSGTLLDAGSGSQGIRSLLDAGWEVTAVDASFDDYGASEGPEQGLRAVVGDVRALPFADAAFDVAIAVDLLEHLDPADRAQAIDELTRVARRRVILACPAGSIALETDRKLSERLASPPGWLGEHLANGFPEADLLRDRLARKGTAHAVGNEHVQSHERLIASELSPVTFVPTRLSARALRWAFRRGGSPRRWARRALLRLRGGDRAPTYRAIVWVDLASASS